MSSPDRPHIARFPAIPPAQDQPRRYLTFLFAPETDWGDCTGNARYLVRRARHPASGTTSQIRIGDGVALH